MTSLPDKFFRGKLTGYQRNAPPAAWERIEQGLDNSGSKRFWLKVAAAIFVLAIPLFILWPKVRHETIATISNSKDAISEPVVEEKSEVVIPSVTVQEVQPSIEKTPKVIHDQSTIGVKNENKRTASVVAENKMKNDIPEEQTIAVSIGSDVEKNNVVEATSPTHVKTSIIVYSAEEVNARFLRHNKSKTKVVKGKEIITTVPVEDKAGHFKAISDVAAAIKYNETSFGDLRQLKDDILSFDFLANNDKSNKNKTQ